MRRRAHTLALVVASVVAMGRLEAQVKPPGTQEAGSAVAEAKRAIDALWAKALAASNAGDAAGLTALYTPDAMLIDPSMPTIVGRANIGKMFHDMFASTKMVGYTHARTALEISGDLAVENGTYTETVQERSKPRQAVSARYTLVFKNVNGHWLILRDIATPMSPGSSIK